MASNVRPFLVVALALLAGTVARAQTVPTTLYVRVEIVPANAKAVFGDHLQNGQDVIAEKIAESLGRRYPWNFKSGEASHFPQLRVKIEHMQDWSVEMFLVGSSTGALRQVARATLWKPGDEDAVVLPPESQWADKIVRAIEHDLLEPDPSRYGVFAHLKNVPLGVAVPGREVVRAQLSEPDLLILPLDAEHFRPWVRCEFTFQYQRPNDTPLKVISNGVGTSPYTPTQRLFDGILVKIDSTKYDAALRAQIATLVQQKPSMFFITGMVEDDAADLSIVAPPSQP
jgi:hypothetical protein